MSRKFKLLIMNILVMILLVWFVPFWTPTNGVRDIATGATPPLGVVRDGPQVILWNKTRMGLYVVVQGAFLLVYVKSHNSSNR